MKTLYAVVYYFSPSSERYLKYFSTELYSATDTKIFLKSRDRTELVLFMDNPTDYAQVSNITKFSGLPLNISDKVLDLGTDEKIDNYFKDDAMNGDILAKMEEQFHPYKLHSTEKSYYCNLHIAGDINHARQVLRKLVMEGACVQLHECDYIYTGGLEKGMLVRFIQYPRFPKSDDEIHQQALRFSTELAKELCQLSFTLEMPDKTEHYRMEGK